MPELLLEIFTEEVPAHMQPKAADDLQRLVASGLQNFGLTFRSIQTFVTPRRMTLCAYDVPNVQPDIKKECKGPSVDASERAIKGFLQSVGLTLNECEKRKTKKGEAWFAIIEQKGRPTADVLVEIIEKALVDIPWPKSMRWGVNIGRWVRPIHKILCLFGNKIVSVKLGSVMAGNETVGHRFLAPDTILVTSINDYRCKLANACVVLDAKERKKLIWEKALARAATEDLVVQPNKGLLDEIAGLVEWPVVLMGKFDVGFLKIPQEVLISSMSRHQKYFSCVDVNGQLAPRFIVVSDCTTTDGGVQIVAGNERVLRARLSDAEFFWQRDIKTTLEARIPALTDMVFHAKLGTMEDKVMRLRSLVKTLSKYIPKSDTKAAARAAFLCKSDLVSEMVCEFPGLQGVMGRYYAVHQGESLDVAKAIAEHYAPRGPADECPNAPVSIVVALADKIDTLVGFWSIGEKPTGSKDPFALRRAALGVIRLIIENKLRLPLSKIFDCLFVSYGMKTDIKDIRSDLLSFFADRLKVHLKEQGVRHDLVSAVFASGDEDDLVRLLARVDALAAFLKTSDGANLLTAYRRAANIVRIEERKEGIIYNAAPDFSVCIQKEEKSLATALDTVGLSVNAALKKEDFIAAMSALAQLRGPVDGFFDQVTVNTKDTTLRKNRLRLLSRISAATCRVADFSKIEG